MKVLVTGGTGFVGSHLVDRLLEKGCDVKCFVRSSSNLRWIKNPKIELVNGSFFDENSMKKAVEDVDYVYHVAGAIMSKTVKGFYISNQLATKNLLEACIKFNNKLKKFVYVSSLAACGPSDDGKPVNEETLCHPITTYGKSKFAGEKEVLSRLNEIPITIIRPPAVYGPRDEGIYSYFKAVNMGIVPLIGFDNKFVSLVHSDDLVSGIILAGENEKSLNNIYFISSDKWYSWKELGEVTKSVIGKKTVTIKIPNSIVYSVAGISQFLGYFSSKGAIFNIEKAQDFTHNWFCDISKAKEHLGYNPKVDISEGIKETIKWYKENGWLK